MGRTLDAIVTLTAAVEAVEVAVAALEVEVEALRAQFPAALTAAGRLKTEQVAI